MVEEIAEQKDLLMISVGTNLDNSQQNIKLAKKYSNIFASVGIHPSEIKPSVHSVGVQTVLGELVDKKNKRKYSQPSDVKFVYQKIAEIKNIELEKVKEEIYFNYKILFNN
ncbi:hypothetical protein COY43_01690 [Candidatus Berkelbacteria bacterium CG_4_10_14_0_8_um_filter_35_9_33_8]|uniref:Hydrolase TatD n=1 Tax=Candidatus Berkelbacteria bacterium CG_4_10_14_0_2_um_filter_35_9_33_12 TaxID=1974499 RepID=A0A2M7W4T2_9BACT|nr:MAG: hypothetical protein COX10_00110 [Candidatus Berkelbacteria bacterium CG23_combo_of_CG06-09_8_20_14_all_33_15]PIZ28214.1 MAG: hypothetical protein COY43_01690 [Candidatus Berkelbacteria bacterium CG_4_10_14_0_8_um_filter_35_9_33_8]PJA20903.1 MAG: hypothetical protein COX60_00420 [Candidatus Berkelbacteria bacterium CG_4_10_14_0_2_um_filter_35_9_33_12]